MYFADSHVHAIFRYDYDVNTGAIRQRRLLTRRIAPAFPTTPRSTRMDPLTAMFDGACLRATPDGQLDRTVPMPVSRPTACAFGGPDLATMHVTTARFRLATDRLAAEPSPAACSLRCRRARPGGAALCAVNDTETRERKLAVHIVEHDRRAARSPAGPGQPGSR